MYHDCVRISEVCCSSTVQQSLQFAKTIGCKVVYSCVIHALADIRTEDFLSDANPKYSSCEVTIVVGCNGKDACEHAANPIALDFLKFRFTAALLFFQPRLKWGNETEAKNIASIMRKAWPFLVNISFPDYPN